MDVCNCVLCSCICVLYSCIYWICVYMFMYVCVRLRECMRACMRRRRNRNVWIYSRIIWICIHYISKMLWHINTFSSRHNCLQLNYVFNRILRYRIPNTPHLSPITQCHSKCSTQWGAVEQRLERRTFNKESQRSNHIAALSKFWEFRSTHIATIHSTI